jgi:integrase
LTAPSAPQFDLLRIIVGLLQQNRPIATGRELRALRRLQREQEPKSAFVFVSERGDPFSTRGFQAMVERAGKTADLGMKIHPHMSDPLSAADPGLFRHPGRHIFVIVLILRSVRYAYESLGVSSGAAMFLWTIEGD